MAGEAEHSAAMVSEGVCESLRGQVDIAARAMEEEALPLRLA